MNVSFDLNNNRRNASLILCNPNGEELYSMPLAKNRQVSMGLNQLSELTFEIPRLKDEDLTPYYDEVRAKRVVKLEGYGQFIITNVDTITDGVVETKEVTCKGLEYEFSSKNLDLIEGTYALYNPTETNKSLLHIVMGYIPTWTIEEVDSELWNTWRTFDLKDNNIFNFLMGEVQEAFDCVFTFDTFNKTLKATKTSNLKTTTDIFLSSRNLMKQLNITENAENIITALNVYGDGDLSIHGVNPLGTATVYDFSYFATTEWMSEELVEAIKAWESKVKAQETTYGDKLLIIKGLNSELISLQTKLKDLEGEKKALEENHSLAVVSGDNENCSLYASKIKEKEIEIENKKKEIKEKEIEIEEVQKELGNVSSSLSFEDNFTEKQRKELSNFIYQMSIQNTNFSVTEETTTQERREIMQELYEWGKKQLQKNSQPRWEFSIDAVNFLNLAEYKETIHQMEFGAEITIEVDKEKNLFAKALLLGFTLNLDNFTDLELKFSNVLNFKNTIFTFEDLFDETASISKTMDFESKNWGLGKEAHSKINEYINSALELTTQEIKATDNQEFTISNVGIRGKEKNPDNDTYLPEEIWINKNTIAFSDDNFNTTKLALGKILLPDGTRGYGLIGDYIVGRVLCGQKLILENEKSTFRVDGDKVYIKNADIIMTSDEGKDQTLEEALQNASQMGGSSGYYQPTPPENPKEGDIWFDTSDGNRPRIYINGLWRDASDQQIQDLKDKAYEISQDLANSINKVYTDMEDMKQAIKDGEIVIFYQEDKPTIPPAKEGDLWYDTTLVDGKKKNEAWIVDNGVWQQIKDSDVVDALDKAENAQITADGKIKTYWQPEKPTGLTAKDLGDLWFDTDDNNKLYRWSGKEWVDVQDKTINKVYDQISNDISSAIGQVYEDMDAMKQAIEDGEMTVYYQSSKPEIPPAKEGDLWYDTTLVEGKKKNEAWIVNDGTWQQIKDSDVTNALDKANQAQITADGKIKTYWQTNQPAGLEEKDLGDLWFDIDDNNKLYRWNGREWIDVQDKSYKQISQDFASSIEEINNKIGDISVSIEDGVIETYYQPTDPMLDSDKSPKIGDLWFDTKNGKLYRHNGGKSKALLMDTLNEGSKNEGSTLEVRPIVGINEQRSVYAEKGGTYNLPQRVLVSLPDNAATFLEVIWDDKHVDTKIEATYTVYGDVVLTDEVINPDNYRAKIKIIVGNGQSPVPPPPQDGISITGVEKISDIKIQQGGSFPLPSKVLVQLSNSTSRYMNVNWNRETVNVNVPNTYTVYGDIQLDAGVTNPENIRPSRKIIVLGDTSSTPTTITSIEKLSPTTIEKGGSYSLPSQVLVTLSVGGQRYMSVKWEDSHVDVWTPNTYTVYGDITLDEGITNPSGLRAEKQIIVQGNVVEQVNITGVTNPEPVIVQKYGQLSLPKQVQVRLSNSSTRYMNVSWDSRNVDTSVVKTYDVYGSIQLENNITNTSNIKAHIQVVVQAEEVQTVNITKVNPLDDVIITVGGAYKLPSTVGVQLSNQSTRQLKVSWRTSSIDIYTPKTYPIEGDIVLEGNITNTQGLKARVNVVVKSSSFTFWDAITDKGIIEAIDQARNAQTTADGKISSYYTPTKPTTSTHPNLSEGDLWIDTDDGNKQYRYTNGQWTDIHDKLIDKVSADLANSITGVYDSMEELKQAIGDGEIVVYYQPNTPSNPKEGDLWYDTDDKNKAYIYKNGRWNSIQDQNIIDALDKAQNAQTTADGKITSYYTPIQPNKSSHPNLSEGDIWVDTDGGNRQYRYTEGQWMDISDSLLGASNNMIINSLPNKNDTKFWRGGDGATVGNHTDSSTGVSQLYFRSVAGARPHINSKYYKCEPNTDYTLSFEYSSSELASCYVLGTNQERSVNDIGNDSITYEHGFTNALAKNPSFSKKEFTFKTKPDETYFYVRFTVESQNSSESGLWFNVKRIKLEKGTKATEWSKSPSEDAFYQVSNITKPDGSLDANQMRGEILAGKTNILCSNTATGRVLALNENGIIVGTANSSGTISQEGTFITKDGVSAEAIKAGTITGIRINGAEIFGSDFHFGEQKSIHYTYMNGARMNMKHDNTTISSWDIFDYDGSTHVGLIAGTTRSGIPSNFVSARTLFMNGLIDVQSSDLAVKLERGRELYVEGDLYVTGSSNAFIMTQHYGVRAVHNDESDRKYLITRGKERTVEGICRIDLDNVFVESIELNSKCPYIINATPYSSARLWVEEVGEDYFIIKSDIDTDFAYQLSAIRATYSNDYMREVKGLRRKTLEKMQENIVIRQDNLTNQVVVNRDSKKNNF